MKGRDAGVRWQEKGIPASRERRTHRGGDKKKKNKGARGGATITKSLQDRKDARTRRERKIKSSAGKEKSFCESVEWENKTVRCTRGGENPASSTEASRVYRLWERG